MYNSDQSNESDSDMSDASYGSDFVSRAPVPKRAAGKNSSHNFLWEITRLVLADSTRPAGWNSHL